MQSKTYPRFGVLGAFVVFNVFFNLIGGTGLIDDESLPVQFLALSKEYLVIRRRLMWSEGLDYCSKCVGEFATFDTPAEATKVSELIYYQSTYPYGYDHGIVKQEFGMNRRYWFGLSDEKSEGEWKWYKTPDDPGTPVKNVSKYRWFSGQPDHIRGNTPEHCGVFWSPEYQLDKLKTKKRIVGRRKIHSFNDQSCLDQLYFICKLGKILPTDPDNPVCNSTGNVSLVSAGNQTWAPTRRGVHDLGDPFTEAEMKDARDLGLQWHNIFRSWHNSPNISLDDELNVKAQSTAEDLVKLRRFERVPGENLYLAIQSSTRRRFSAVKMIETAITDWYYEMCDTEHWPKGKMSHFTQIVWKDTKKLGIGIARNKENSQIHIVARYEPVGNYEGEIDHAVGPVRCGEGTLCDGTLPKHEKLSAGDCPQGNATAVPTSKGRSIVRKLNKHKGESVLPVDRPPKILDKRKVNLVG